MADCYKYYSGEAANFVLDLLFLTICDIIFLLSCPIRQRKGGVLMLESIVSLFIAVMGDIVSHYVIKWLDSDMDDN